MPWYSLYNDVLHRTFTGHDIDDDRYPKRVYIAPQYPLWLFDTEYNPPIGLPSSDYDNDVPMALSDSERAPTSSGRIVTYSQKDSSSSLPPSSPPVPSSPTQTPSDTRLDSTRVTDFAVLCIFGSKVDSDPTWNIIGIAIPAVVEVKRYCVEADLRRREVFVQLGQAQHDVTVQVEYLFSGLKQARVCAIAAAGPYWQWAIFTRSDVELANDDNQSNAAYIPSSDVIEELDVEWSIIYKMGTNESTAELQLINQEAGRIMRRV